MPTTSNMRRQNENMTSLCDELLPHRIIILKVRKWKFITIYFLFYFWTIERTTNLKFVMKQMFLAFSLSAFDTADDGDDDDDICWWSFTIIFVDLVEYQKFVVKYFVWKMSLFWRGNILKIDRHLHKFDSDMYKNVHYLTLVVTWLIITHLVIEGGGVHLIAQIIPPWILS